MDDTPTAAPLLFIDQSIFVENDIGTFGSLSTLSDPQKLALGRGGGGAVAMGHGWTSPYDDPIIFLAEADHNTLWLKAKPLPPNEAEPLAVNWPWGSMELYDLLVNGKIMSRQSWLYSHSPIYIVSGYNATSISDYGYLDSGGVPVTFQAVVEQ